MRLTPAEEDEIELAFGRLVTQTRFEFDFPPVPVKIEAVSELLQSFDSIQRQKDVRLAFIYNPDEDQDLILFINGKEIILSEGVAEAVEILSRDHQIEIAELGEAVKNPEFLDLLGRLLAWEMFELS